MESVTDEAPFRRSKRNKRTHHAVDLAPVLAQDMAQPAAPTGTMQNAKKKNKRKRSSTEPNQTDVKHEASSAEQPHEPRYFCPISGCTYSRSQARSLKLHYNTQHMDLTYKEEWYGKLAKTMPHHDWLAEKERLDASTKVKQVKPPKKAKKAKSPLARSAAPGCQPIRAAGTPDGTEIGSAAGEGEGGPRSQLQTPAASSTVAATAPVASDRGERSSSPTAKRRNLHDLVEQQGGQLEDFIAQELKEAHKRAVSAEAKLHRMATEREAEMARSEEVVRRMGGKLRNLEREIQDEKDFGSSMLLKELYSNQAKHAARLNPNRPEHGGFVY